MHTVCASFSFFFFNDTATTEIYTLSLHDALPIYKLVCHASATQEALSLSKWQLIDKSHREDLGNVIHRQRLVSLPFIRDRKSTRLNSSHGYISYAVFCLKKKKKIQSSNIKLVHTT